MKISIFGLGYVGAVAAGCLAKRGHTIVGVDVHPQKVESLNQGVAPIYEPGLDELLQAARAQNRLRATTDCNEAIAATEASIVCVGTPSAASGALDLSYVREVTRQIGDALRAKQQPHILALRSTMLPGSTEALVKEHLGDLLAAGSLRVFYYPEFLRESTAVRDFEEPGITVVGARADARPDAALLREFFDAQTAVVDWPTAEFIKYACNAFHAAKIVFANEIGRVGKQIGVDSRQVMELLCQDKKLNLSPYYLRPGNPFGGSCLPKDLRALTHHASHTGVDLPMLGSLLASNERHLRALLGVIEASGRREICILGLSFKANTDDLRESSMVAVAHELLARGYTLRIFDPALNITALVGANQRAMESKIPRLASLLQRDLASALGRGGLVVAAQKCVPVADLARHVTAQHHLLDVNGWEELRALPAKYEGFCW